MPDCRIGMFRCKSDTFPPSPAQWRCGASPQFFLSFWGKAGLVTFDQRVGKDDWFCEYLTCYGGKSFAIA